MQDIKTIERAIEELERELFSAVSFFISSDEKTMYAIRVANISSALKDLKEIKNNFYPMDYKEDDVGTITDPEPPQF